MTSGGLGIDELGFKRYLRDTASVETTTQWTEHSAMLQRTWVLTVVSQSPRRVSGDYARSNVGERTALSARMVNISASMVSFLVILVSSIWVL